MSSSDLLSEVPHQHTDASTRRRPGRSGVDGPDRWLTATADLGLLALALGTAAAFTRLFDDWSFLWGLAVPLVVGWAVAVLLRHLRVPMFATVVMHLVVGVVVLTVVFAPGTHLFGVPTGASIDLLQVSVTNSFSEFAGLVSPVAPSDGFLIVIAAGLWIFALFADTAAFRYSAPVQASIPYVSTFLATGILAHEHGRGTASICFVAGLGVYAVTERTLRASEGRWVGHSRQRGSRSIGLVAALIGICALIAGTTLGPLLPGGSEPVVNLRDLGKGGGPRTVISPFVGLRSLLEVRSDTEMFTVRSTEPAYWRLTALEEFDATRDIWVSRGSYRPTDGALPTALDPAVPGTPLRQDIQTSGLAGVWLPGAYDPRVISTGASVSFDRDSASIILREDQSAGSPSIGYRLDSVIPDFAGAADARPGTAADLDSVYLEVPALAPEVSAALSQITQDRPSAFARAIALQDWFRNEFTYDQNVDYRDAEDPLVSFLSQRRGFCQQFSSAFALMARSIGLPSRVAVGFTPGDPVAVPANEAVDGVADVEYVVRGRHAHAWPEIYFEGVGWVPFEPTPGRGDPQATEYTGVEAAQAQAPPLQAATTTSIAAPGETVPGTSTPPSTVANEVDAVADPTATDGSGGGATAAARILVVVAIALVAGGALLAATVLTRRRHRGRGRGRGGDARIGDAWSRAAGWLSVIGLRPEPWETPTEFADRAAIVLEDAGAAGASGASDGDDEDEAHGGDRAATAEALRALAVAETSRRYGVAESSPERLAIAEASAVQIEDHVRRGASRRERLGHLIRG